MRVSHAHPLSSDARASGPAIAIRRDERAARRRTTPSLGRTRLALPAAIVAVAVLAVALQPAPAATHDTPQLNDHDGMDLAVGAPRVSPGSTPVTEAAAPAAIASGREVIDDAAAVAPLTGYRWPLENARITQGFGPSSDGLFVVNGQRFHDGIDIANYCGAPILAAHDGRVIAASRQVVGALGWTGDTAAYNTYVTSKNLWAGQARIIVIDDGNGFRSVYVHLHRIDVKVGQVVTAGQQIGLEGNSGHATGCHLHYSIYAATTDVRWATYPKDVDRYHLPTGELARVDPLAYLPPLVAGEITWGWGANDGG